MNSVKVGCRPAPPSAKLPKVYMTNSGHRPLIMGLRHLSSNQLIDRRVTVRRSIVAVAVALCSVFLCLGCGQTKENQDIGAVNTVASSSEGTPPQPDLPIEDQLGQYTVLSAQDIQVGGATRTAWQVKREHSNLVGYVAAIDSRLVPIREPDKSAPGLAGPWSAASLTQQDLDGDGKAEYLLFGAVGAHSTGLWVQQFDEQSKTFRYSGSLVGDRGVRVLEQPDGTVIVEVKNRDYLSPDPEALVTQGWRWKSDHFEKEP